MPRITQSDSQIHTHGQQYFSWHTDQLHRVGAGLEPDLERSRLATTVAMVRRNGRVSFARKRGL